MNISKSHAYFCPNPVKRYQSNSFINIKTLYMMMLWFPSDHNLNLIDDKSQRTVFVPQISMSPFE